MLCYIFSRSFEIQNTLVYGYVEDKKGHESLEKAFQLSGGPPALH